MNVALFGGTFDPVHSGHLSAARAALQGFALDLIYFVPASMPPHKQGRSVTAFHHRYAMVALACAGESRFLPSLLEAPEFDPGKPNYAITTVRKLIQQLSEKDRLYFLIGTDAFLDIHHWHEWKALLECCDFIIASRPGFPISEIAQVIPQELRGGPADGNSIPLLRTRLHLLTTVDADISSSAIRQLASEGQPIRGLVPAAVEEYVQKLGLFIHANQTS
ncbi:MAG: nicotinate (nicotinamide) nucleotide adenylyltransferase [Acidobacteria bacterium]|nr:nicotinate (nicotinamide) nucleotide adenylyltransferase [Acidobacteriota bacterium]